MAFLGKRLGKKLGKASKAVKKPGMLTGGPGMKSKKSGATPTGKRASARMNELGGAFGRKRLK